MKNIIILISLILVSISNFATPLDTSFTYQGELIVNGQPANSNYDISVNLYNDEIGGASLGGAPFSNHNVANGLFSLEIDIGATPFIGDEVWIELSIKPAGAGSYTDLPRQKITNSPYAIHAQFVGSSGVNSDAIQSAAVTNFKLADNAVTQNKIQSGSVGTLQIINASITNSKLANNAIDSSKILDNSIISDDIADGAIIANDIATSAINSSKIQDGSITAVDINNNSVQQRISATCPVGESIRAISNTGGVTCEVDDVGTLGWGLTGNAGTTPGTNFIGTTDNTDFIIKVGAKQIIKLTADSPTTGLNVVLGHDTNIISGAAVSSINGGQGNVIKKTSPFNPANWSTIGGGKDNEIFAQTNENAEYSTISGGFHNHITASEATISGGSFNYATGKNSTVPGGGSNTAGGDYSFAAGAHSLANHLGSFVWTDAIAPLVNGMQSTADNQFLIRATGGVGIGTNAPSSPLHIKGQGTSTGSIAASNEVVMTIEPKVSTDKVAVVINKLDENEESALIFSTSSNPNFDLRMIKNASNRDQLDFNHYDAGTKQTLMSLDYWSGTKSTVFLNADVWPDISNLYDLGQYNYRWRAIYSVNALDVSSDKRLKKNITNISYGLAEVLAMRPVSYNWKKGNTKRTNLGLIAQEVETIIPEVVSKSNDDLQTRSMRYSELIPVLIKATQDQQTLIEQQNNKITTLELLVEQLLNHKSNK